MLDGGHRPRGRPHRAAAQHLLVDVRDDERALAHELPVAAHQARGHALPVVPAARDRDGGGADGERSGPSSCRSPTPPSTRTVASPRRLQHGRARQILALPTGLSGAGSGLATRHPSQRDRSTAPATSTTARSGFTEVDRATVRVGDVSAACDGCRTSRRSWPSSAASRRRVNCAAAGSGPAFSIRQAAVARSCVCARGGTRILSSDPTSLGAARVGGALACVSAARATRSLDAGHRRLPPRRSPRPCGPPSHGDRPPIAAR